MERGRGASDFYLKAARGHTFVPVEEARDRAGSKRDGAHRSGQVFLQPPRGVKSTIWPDPVYGLETFVHHAFIVKAACCDF